MKTNRHGRAKVLTQSEIQLIFSDGLDNDRDCALFGVCLFSAKYNYNFDLMPT
ncbi:MAG: hypothetical protein V7K98_19505 [Nostoc sp.]